jgi:phosphoglycerol transferase
MAGRLGRLQATTILVVVGLVGVLDTNPGFSFTAYEDTAANWSSDRAFVREVEGLIGLDAELFQIPVIPFPEHPPVHRMVDYDHLRGYLHSDTLGWSYGGVKGRAADWQQRLVGLPLDELAKSVAGVGFDGLWVDRYGYSDPGIIESYLGAADLVSADGRLVVYDLRPIREAVLVGTGTEEMARSAAALTEPVTVKFGDGFHGAEVDAGRLFAWAPDQARLYLPNPTTATRSVVVAFVIASAVDGEWFVELSGLAERQRLSLGAAGTMVSVAIDVPPGGGSVNLVSDAPRLATTDPRDIRFRVLDPVVKLPPVG